MRLSILAVFSFLVLFSCKDDDDIVANNLNNPAESYIPVTVGSYWKYQWYKVDTLGNSEEVFGIDSIIALKDTVINNLRYVKFADNNSLISTQTEYSYLRETLGDIYKSQNNLIFSRTNFQDTLGLTVAPPFLEVVYKMNPGEKNISTQFGTLVGLNRQGRVTPIPPTTFEERTLDNFYVKGIGKVLESQFFFSTINTFTYERRLIEYHIEPE